jgi:hypothetical protein
MIQNKADGNLTIKKATGNVIPVAFFIVLPVPPTVILMNLS